MVIGGLIFAGLAVLCIVGGWLVVRSRGDFEPMSEEELEAEAEEDL
jgi:hypothetical protein